MNTKEKIESGLKYAQEHPITTAVSTITTLASLAAAGYALHKHFGHAPCDSNYSPEAASLADDAIFREQLQKLAKDTSRQSSGNEPINGDSNNSAGARLLTEDELFRKELEKLSKAPSTSKILPLDTGGSVASFGPVGPSPNDVLPAALDSALSSSSSSSSSTPLTPAQTLAQILATGDTQLTISTQASYAYYGPIDNTFYTSINGYNQVSYMLAGHSTSMPISLNTMVTFTHPTYGSVSVSYVAQQGTSQQHVIITPPKRLSDSSPKNQEESRWFDKHTELVTDSVIPSYWEQQPKKLFGLILDYNEVDHS